MKFLPLTQGKVAIIDDDEFEKVGHFKWCASLSGAGGIFYACRGMNGKKTYLHCVIMGVKGIDHINGDGLDCRRENMRRATSQQNHWGFKRKSAGCSSSFRGVSWCKRDQMWRAYIRHLPLGSFINEEDAARAYDKKALELGFFKEALNFPN